MTDRTHRHARPAHLIHGLLLALLATPTHAAPPPGAEALEAEMHRAMALTQARGLAVAVIDGGRVRHVLSLGERNREGQPLLPDTVMYGASLTKLAFAHLVLQLVDEGKLQLDRPIGEYLDRPLPDYGDLDRYADWSALSGDERWRRLTPRILLTHAGGFANFGFLEPDGKLRFHFDPGARYAYSGDGLILLQFVIERGLGLDVGALMRERMFVPWGMVRTSLDWRPDFAGNVADGWRADGSAEPHDERSTVRAAGSMDTTIADMARFAAAHVRGERLSEASRLRLTQPELAITTATQFPTLQPELPETERWPGLAAGLGMVVFDGPQGPGYMKGGHNDSTGNTLVCLERGKRCVVILSNDVRAEAAFPHLVAFVLGPTGAPWRWEYGAMTFVPAPMDAGTKPAPARDP